MLESIFTAFPSLTTTAKAIEVFDAFRKGRKGDVRSLIEELTAKFASMFPCLSTQAFLIVYKTDFAIFNGECARLRIKLVSP